MAEARGPAAETKLVALVLFLLAVVLTPARAWPALLVDGALLAGLMVAGRVPLRWLATRATVVAPFLVFAAVLPFVAHGPRVPVGGWSLSRPGLEGGALVAARAVLGVTAALLVAATTPSHRLIEGTERLGLPSGLTSILTLMARFTGVVGDDVRRIALARAARGDGRSVAGRWAATSAGVGSLFVRSYERGERVHLAMLARGYHDHLPAYGAAPRATAFDWLGALAVPAVAFLALAAALLLPLGSVGPFGPLGFLGPFGPLGCVGHFGSAGPFGPLGLFGPFGQLDPPGSLSPLLRPAP